MRFSFSNLLGLLCLSGNFAMLQAQAMTPSDSQSVLLKASGSLWGATEDAFATHAFSLKSDRGVAIWHDSQPDSIILVNPENRTYLVESLFEYLDDNHYGVHYPLKFDTAQSKIVKLKDGASANEVTYFKKRRLESTFDSEPDRNKKTTAKLPQSRLALPAQEVSGKWLK